MNEKHSSIFQRYYDKETFIDRFETEPENAMDVIIPIIHANELWKSNLLSAYREIPINRLLIGDGGCTDNSIEIVKEFPRVVVFDHSGYKTLGYSIRKLIEAVEADWFIYLHSDVYLPDDWFNAMREHQESYDWYECSQQITVLVEYLKDIRKNKRGFGFGGSHMGRRVAFEQAIKSMDDDYIYRNEDIIIRTLVEREGFRCGKVGDIFHYHQVMHKEGTWGPKIKAIDFQLEMSKEEEIRTYTMQAKGFIKYLEPSPVLVRELQNSLFRLLELKAIDFYEFKKWVVETNPKWLPYMSKKHLIVKRLATFLKSSYKLIIDR